MTSGTTTELNLADFLRQHNLQAEAVVFEDSASVDSAYVQGRCDVITSDKSALAATRSGLENPEDHVILPETISKEPLTPVVPHGDDQWLDLVKTVLYVLINAEEFGVTQANVEQMKQHENIQIRRMLGTEGEFGQGDLGLKADVCRGRAQGGGELRRDLRPLLGSGRNILHATTPRQRTVVQRRADLRAPAALGRRPVWILDLTPSSPVRKGRRDSPPGPLSTKWRGGGFLLSRE